MKTPSTFFRNVCLISLICFSALQLNAQRNIMFTSQVSASSDDAEEQGSNGSSPGSMDLTSSDLELVRDGNDGDQFVGIRFTNISIPLGSTIDSAYIQFTVDEDDTITGPKIIKVEAVDDATTFTGVNSNISSRTTSGDSVIWSNIPVWPTVGAAGPDQRTPDLSLLINGIFSRSGWAIGNAINFIITGSGERVAESFDGTSSSAPQLVIYYKPPLPNRMVSFQVNASTDDAEEQGANGSSPGTMDLTSSDLELVRDGNDGDQFVGIRFNSISLPQGAVIDSAYVQFTVDEDDTITGPKYIQIEAIDNSPTFSSGAFNISNRTTTQDSVSWNNIPTWPTVGASGPDQRTPDIGGLISAVVNRSGWTSGNALSLIFSGSGERVAESFDGVSSSAPELIVYYKETASVSFQVNASSDDAEEQGSNGSSPGSMDLTSSDLELVRDGNDGDQFVGIRFTNVIVPADASVIDAYIQFTVDEDDTITGPKIIKVEAADNATTFTGTNSNISSRPTTADSVIWSNIPVWPTVGAAGPDQRTPNISSLINGVMARPGWSNGNAINVIFSGSGERVAESFDGTSSSAPELVIRYVTASYIDGNFPISRLSSWKYDDSGTDLSSTNWTDLAYNDSSWAYGDGILGYGNGNEITTLDFGPNPNNKHITTYLRHTFNVSDAQMYDSLIFNVLRDDGVVVYVNGTEVFRQNMPTGPVGFNTLASAAVGGANETNYFRTGVANALVNGRNVIAVELHQSAANSSDLSFDMEVEGKVPPLATSTYPIQSGDEWNYLDDGTDLTATNWKDLNYNDTAWVYGPAPLGYSNNSTTTVSFGPDPNNKYITTYFRKRMNIANLANLSDSIVLGVRRDDGAVVYINGTEIFRTNMPTGAIGFNTTASVAIGGSAENTFYPITLHKSSFIQGDNIVAVEVHQANGSSSDLSFDLEMSEKPVARRSCTGINDQHISCYTSLFPTSQGPDFVIPSTHAFQVLIEQGDSYSNQTVRTTVPGNNDMTGYIPRAGSSIDGFLGINHENTPGGVSILDLRYIDSNRLWTVDSSQAVDFYNNDLVTTTRNCSGGITPWGTYISSEETTNAGDVNADGYQDVGWQVEIDPVTRSVKEYGTPGKQEKLWALGRMSHENIAVANDSITAYEGEDRGTGCLYKFIANSPGDLSSGTLYALRLDSGLLNGEPLLSTGTWIVIPNTTQADRNTTNSLALSLGATPFNGIEDAEIGTIDGKIYFTSKGNNRVYRFNDASTTTVNQFETFVGGRSYLINHGNGVVSEPWGGGNDNLVFDDLGNLYVLQDGSRDHIWMVGPNHSQASPQVDIFAKLPAGSEPCGMTFTPDYKFMFVSVQHPSGANSSTTQIDAAGYGATMAQSTTVVIARKEFLGNYAPTQAATNLSFTTTACDSIDLTFNTGNGTGHLIVASENIPVSETPDDGITYNADNTFGNGDDLGQNNYVIYEGLDSSITIRGLKQNTTYHVSIFDFNAAPSNYYIDSPSEDSASTAAVGTSAISGSFNVPASSSQQYNVSNTVGSSYNWTTTAGSVSSGQGSNQITLSIPSGMGTLDLKVVETNASGCEGDTVIQSINYGTVGLKTVKLQDAISIIPNPSDGRTTLNVTGNGEALQLVIYDIQGKEVLRSNKVISKFEIDLSHLRKGTYLLQLNSSSDAATKRLIIQ